MKLKVKSNAVGKDNVHPKFVKLILPKILKFITHIFNSILTKSEYPTRWKFAKIIPIPKANNEFRPISILSNLSKVFEDFKNKLLTDRQSGYRSNRCCTIALIDTVEEIRGKIDSNNLVFLLLLDHSKALDTVNHNIQGAIQKLQYVSNCALSSGAICLKILPFDCLSLCHVVLNFDDI